MERGAAEFATGLLPAILDGFSKMEGYVARNIAIELYAVKEEPLFPPDYSGPTIATAITQAATRYADSASLVSRYSLIATTYFHETPNALSFAPSANEILDVVDLLLQLEVGSKACSALVKRIMSANLVIKPRYVQENLASVFSGLVDDYGDLDCFRRIIQKFLIGWKDRVLGNPPQSLDSEVANLRRWTCSCEHCEPARSFLINDPEREISMTRIGAVNRRHVEAQIQAYAPSTATYDTISTSPQGLRITKSKVWTNYVRWHATFKLGPTILKSVAPDEQSLKHVLGKHYDVITGALRVPGNTTASLTVPIASASTQQQGRPRPSGELPPAKRQKTSIK
ncbi:hypothetical protein K474DRAFT_1769095 [Panus rudis PR-1116 ss-1]|nr:hypothetical protein K474DRAFT_1769095 [Panus rudis PR-1116 ss-1]